MTFVSDIIRVKNDVPYKLMELIFLVSSKKMWLNLSVFIINLVKFTQLSYFCFILELLHSKKEKENGSVAIVYESAQQQIKPT